MHPALAAANTRPVDDDYHVAGQIAPDDVQVIVAAGYKSIICNRPDGEASDQTPWADIEKAATDQGVAFYYIPVSNTGLTVDNVQATAALLDEIEKPVFAYCRSGARSTQLYQIAKQKAG